MPELVVAPCSAQAARYAVTRWHYSHSLPPGRLVRFGVWEDGRFVGAVVFGRGANSDLVSPYGLTMTEGCELVRVALRDHHAPVSQVVAASLRQLKATNPGLRLVVSYADPHQGHHGGIYQAGNWIYGGMTSPAAMYRHRRTGKIMHERECSATGVKPQFGRLKRVPRYDECERIKLPGKHRYLYPLDKATRRAVRRLAQPYPSATTARNRKSDDKLHAVEASEVTRGGSTAESRVRSPATAPQPEPEATHG